MLIRIGKQLIAIAVILTLGVPTAMGQGGGGQGGAQQITGGGTGAAGGGTGGTARTGAGGAGGGQGGGGVAQGFDSGSIVDASAFSNAEAFGATVNQGQGGFVGRNDSSGRFVGNTQAGGQAAFQQTPNFGNRSAASGQSNRGSTSSTRNLNVVRPVLRIAFTHPTIGAGKASDSLKSQIERIKNNERFTDIGIAIDDKATVTLTGEVETSHEAKLLALIARMEPGVRKVKNEIRARDYEKPAAPE